MHPIASNIKGGKLMTPNTTEHLYQLIKHRRRRKNSEIPSSGYIIATSHH
jgi:hypothetical protein